MVWEWWISGYDFCDLSRAFDCVEHENLLSKLNGYGIIWGLAENQYINLKYKAEDYKKNIL